MASGESKAQVGIGVGRVDGAAKVTGRARYVDDLPPREGEIFGATVRSSVDRGVIRGIERDPSFDWEGVTVVTAVDVPVNVVQLLSGDQPVLAAERVNHRYEPVALVACEDRTRLAHAVRALKVDIDALPAVVDPAIAIHGEPLISGEDNVQNRYLITKGAAASRDTAGPDSAGLDSASRDSASRDSASRDSAIAIAAALARCDVVVRGSYASGHQEQLYIEPQGMVAWWDGEDVHAIGSLQCPYFVVKAFAHALGRSPAQIHISQAVTGGGFGGKEEYPSLIGLHAALLAKKSGRPVRLVYDRVEDIEATPKRHPSVCEIATGCDANGTLRVLDMRVTFDAGAYVTLTPVVLSRGVLHAGGAYRWRDARIEGLSVTTNTPPNGAFRGFGAPQTIWAMERHLDRIARELGRDPADLKLQNLLRQGDTTPTGQVLRDSVGGVECVHKTLTASGYHDKRARGPVVRGRKARGVGCSMFMHGGGFTGDGERRLKGKVAVDLLAGGRLRIRTSSTDMGQGTETVLAQIAAEAAGLPLDAVEMAAVTTGKVPDSGPTVASRTVMVVGSIVEKAAREVAERVEAERASGEGWGQAADRLLAREGTVSSLKQYEPPSWVRWDESTYKGDAYPVFAWMCDVAEVEVDLDTFEVAVVGFWQAADVGKAINPVMCVGQLEGGTLQSIGWAICEEVVWESGRILNPRMANYIIPTALDAPPFETMLVEAPFAHGPGGGAKGIGELPMDGGAAAVAAAVEHATGVVMDQLPLTPERLLERSLLSRGAAW